VPRGEIAKDLRPSVIQREVDDPFGAQLVDLSDGRLQPGAGHDRLERLAGAWIDQRRVLFLYRPGICRLGRDSRLLEVRRDRCLRLLAGGLLLKLGGCEDARAIQV